ncbi:MAG: type II toxin-antitoxin system VapC family toxin [Candidatus Aminicenantes bacterium]|nr:type II toxin-antitoxin system VapC family toxin [Candidatus Aminicenantes bacterium]
MNYFFDTSALVKVYHREDRSESVFNIFNSPANKVYISELSIVEYYSVVYRKFREKYIDNADLEKILKRFETDLSNRFELLMFDSPVTDNAKEIFRILGQGIFVRSLDVLQLGFFKSYLDSPAKFLTYDLRQNSALEELKKKDFF